MAGTITTILPQTTQYGYMVAAGQRIATPTNDAFNPVALGSTVSNVPNVIPSSTGAALVAGGSTQQSVLTFAIFLVVGLLGLRYIFYASGKEK